MQDYKDSLKFKNWLDSLKKNNINVQSITEKAIIHKPNGEVLFCLLNVDAKDSAGQKLLPTVLIRGHFVSVVTCLLEKETGKRYFLLVKQRRVGNGEVFYEHPAGMCDSETDPYKVAEKEVEEETGLKIEKKDLELLWETPLYSSPGLLDEAGYFFCCEISMSAEEIHSFRDRLTGAEHEHEFIQTHVCESTEIFNLLKNSNGIMATMLFQKKKGIS